MAVAPPSQNFFNDLVPIAEDGKPSRSTWTSPFSWIPPASRCRHLSTSCPTDSPPSPFPSLPNCTTRILVTEESTPAGSWESFDRLYVAQDPKSFPCEKQALSRISHWQLPKPTDRPRDDYLPLNPSAACNCACLRYRRREELDCTGSRDAVLRPIPSQYSFKHVCELAR